MKTIHYWLITSFVLGFFSDGITQSFITNWSSHLGSSEEDYALASCVDHQNNVYTLGVFSDTAFYADQQTVTSKGRTDFFLSKHNPSGELLWIKTFGGPEYDGADNLFFSVVTFPCDIQIDQEGEIYIFGNHKGTGDFDPGPDEYLLSSIGNNGFILKLTENGDFIFGQSYPHTYFQSMAISDSSIYLSGAFSQSVDFDLSINETILQNSGYDAFILKLSHSGNYQKVIQFFSEESALVLDMEFDNYGSDLYISGAFRGQLAFDTSLITNGFNNFFTSEFLKGYIMKIDESLSELRWFTMIETTDNGVIKNIKVADTNNLTVSGDFKDSLSVMVNNELFTNSSPGPTVSFLALVNPQNGQFKKILCFGNDDPIYIHSLNVDQSSNIFFVSFVREAPLVLELNNFSLIIESSGIRNAFVIMMDTSFNYINHFSACAGDYIFDINDISIGLNNEINIAGTHSAPAYLCNAPNDVFPQFQGSYDAIGVQLVYDFTTVAGSLSTTISTNIYPNPFTNQINYTCSEEDSCGKIRFELYDITGRLLFTEYKDAVNGQYTILTHQLPVGVFYLRLYGENQLVKSFKMIKL